MENAGGEEGEGTQRPGFIWEVGHLLLIAFSSRSTLSLSESFEAAPQLSFLEGWGNCGTLKLSLQCTLNAVFASVWAILSSSYLRQILPESHLGNSLGRIYSKNSNNERSLQLKVTDLCQERTLQ